MVVRSTRTTKKLSGHIVLRNNYTEVSDFMIMIKTELKISVCVSYGKNVLNIVVNVYRKIEFFSHCITNAYKIIARPIQTPWRSASQYS
jgi:hypothetical protein